MKAPHGPVRITDNLLRTWPLPSLNDSAGREDRGRGVIMAGPRNVAGAALLAAEAALRAGGGQAPNRHGCFGSEHASYSSPACRARSRPSHRPSLCEPGSGEPSQRRRGRPMGAFAREGQRSRPDLDSGSHALTSDYSDPTLQSFRLIDAGFTSYMRH
jgi:hypothetical protein